MPYGKIEIEMKHNLKTGITTVEKFDVVYEGFRDQQAIASVLYKPITDIKPLVDYLDNSKNGSGYVPIKAEVKPESKPKKKPKKTSGTYGSGNFKEKMEIKKKLFGYTKEDEEEEKYKAKTIYETWKRMFNSMIDMIKKFGDLF
ncbi:hypothetical protein DRH29_03550 [candidate division Kazan bacterium]|uniref:Uncharacterized protein n=1 Tax=candidate division Kazan bacterium TaxID=2202143 RepID=A0A420ZC86_UNCK3|nr:MAG: hypothetical protein DRH29_03550 [candidate division Kazan bacterium]